MRISVLDHGTVTVGGTPAEALHNSVELAKLAEQRDYHRVWIAKHRAVEEHADCRRDPAGLAARLQPGQRGGGRS